MEPTHAETKHDGAYTPGSEVGGYRIGARLGSGAMGAVYSAYDGGGSLVAIKFLHSHLDADTRGRERLRREAAALRRLRDPAVAQVLDAELDGPEAFIVTELVDGPTLEAEIAERGPLDSWDLFELADQLACALDRIHAAGVIHRDMKPSNVLVASRGPVLIDFGIAQGFEDARVTATGLVMGTPGYLAPEQLTGAQPSPATDWWGWAALLAYAATGRAPFGVRPLDVVLARASAGQPDLSGLGPITTAALAGALTADPKARWSPSDVVAALRQAADEGDDGPAVSPHQATAATSLGMPPAIAPNPTELASLDGPEHDDGQSAPPVPLSRPPVIQPDLPVPQRRVHDGRTAAVAVGGSGQGAAPSPVALPPTIPPGTPLPAPGTPVAGQGPAGSVEATLPGPGAVQGVPGQIGPGQMAPGQMAPGQVAPMQTAPPQRKAAIALFGVALVLFGVTHPGLLLVVAAVCAVAMRFVGVSAWALHRRRAVRGPGPRDSARIIAASPWYAARAVVGSLLSIGLATALAVGVIATGSWIDGHVAIGFMGGPSMVSIVASAVACALFVLLLWAGPMTALTRYGCRVALAKVAPGSVGTAVLVVVGVVLVILTAATLLAGQTIDWWPLTAPSWMR